MTSIIIPIYNTEKYLKACILSVLNQSVPEWELILVDDGSTDGSMAIAKQYAQQDRRITVLQQVHSGQSVARNYGRQHAKGEYIAFLDADDRWDPDWLAIHLGAITGVDYVQSGYTRSGKTYTPRNQYQFTSPCMRLYRTDAVQFIHFPDHMIYEDVLWSVDLWTRGATCRMIDYTGYHYTVNPHSTTSQPHQFEEKVLFDLLKDRLRHASWKGKLIILYTLARLKIHFTKK